MALDKFRRRVVGDLPGDFADLERWERRIQRDMLLGLAMGVFAGALATLGAGRAPAQLFAATDTYLYLGVVILAGRLSLGSGWALVNCTLTAFGMLISRIVCAAVFGGESPLDGGVADSLNLLLFLMVLSGVLASLTRLRGMWGDAAAGGLAVLFLIDVVDGHLDRMNGAVLPTWEWAASMSFVLGLVCALCLRPTLLCRLRAAGIALALAALYTLAVAS
ncbi:hypothetical protein [Microtetraspora sp. NBRC 16547]|uniref:hypothetical protein n=1 Tax=Microtetraspora sp. NBRC 16547 TaxID=3030993 RepID=UPI0024A29A8B|nr:hypothetical protein [Microtetraspora sp. NBRC 16547]GLW98029.1 hypothetical protein Misp02_21160 [Microtetraspora sp. NBRC 16547]